jgi:tRNA modification GTPase
MDAAASLKVALAWLSSYDSRVELVAESLRAASRSLDMLIGRIGVEDILGEIFSSFCIGK